jgi:branched-chain amino acid transport system permease protein
MNRLIRDVPPHGLVGLLVLGAVLLVLPLFTANYLIQVMVLVLYFAYVGQTWNIMMGFAGQLSLGHALYLGLGGYAAAVLFVKFGISPWIGMLVGMVVSGIAGGIIGFLGFRFGVRGVYFALLTIAFAEFTRILFDHWDWVAGSSGLFIPVTGAKGAWTLRGGPALFYYVMLAFTAAVLVLSRWLLCSRLGYYWLAIREDQEAAQALGINVFRYKLAAVVLSASLTSVAGVVLAFQQNNLFPEQAFAISESIVLIFAPIVGGTGTLIGPILGAFLLTPLGEALTLFSFWLEDRLVELLGIDLKLDGIKQIFFGLCVVAIVSLQPNGLWPWIARRLGLDGRREW